MNAITKTPTNATIAAKTKIAVCAGKSQVWFIEGVGVGFVGGFDVEVGTGVGFEVGATLGAGVAVDAEVSLVVVIV